MDRSQAWVSGIESDRIALDSIELINRAARVLRVEPGEITGHPGVLASPLAERAAAAVTGIRRVVQRWDLPPDWPIDPRPLPDLQRAVAHLTALRRRARYADLGEAVPDVLRELHAACHAATGAEAEPLYGLLAMAYKEADTVAHNLGHDDLATLAIERIRWAAERSADPNLAAIGDYLRVRDLWAHCLYDDALLVIEHRLQAAEHDLDPTVTGSLYLRGAITAARGGSEATALEWMGRARGAVEHIAAAADRYELTFTPANVAIHDVSVAVEAFNGSRAVTLAASTRLEGPVPPSRAARYHLDVARGCVWHGLNDKALSHLEAADRIAPLMIRNSPHAKDAVTSLLSRGRPGQRERLRRLAGHMQIA